MRVLVFSHRHALLPFAWRLKREGHDVEVTQVNAKESYQRAWEGRFTSFLQGKDRVSDSAAQSVLEAAVESGSLVVTDSTKWSERFRGYKYLYGVYQGPTATYSPVQLGAWFDGEEFHLPHLLVDDVGAWPGGLGPRVPAATTMAWLRAASTLIPLLATRRDELKSAGFKGLVNLPLDGQMQPTGVRAGWLPLHTHAFIGELTNLGEVLAGGAPSPGALYVTAVVVSIPPWPLRCNVRADEVEVGVPRELLSQCFFHDMRVEGEQVRTAGLDGLVCVVRGAGHLPTSAAQRAVAVASAIQLSEKQFRPDAGRLVPAVLDRLYHEGWL